MNSPSEKKGDILPSYDFVPVRPSVGSLSPPSNFDSADDDVPLRTWNSFYYKANISSIRIKVIESDGERTRQDLPKLIKLAESGIFNMEAVISSKYKFEGAVQACKDLDQWGPRIGVLQIWPNQSFYFSKI